MPSTGNLPVVVAVLMVAVASWNSCCSGSTSPRRVHSQPVLNNLLDAVEYYGAFIFLKYVSIAGLNATLQNPQENLTVFAPADTAFLKLSPDMTKALESDPALLKEVITFHICQGPVRITTDDSLLPTLSGYDIRVNVYNNPNITTVSGSTILLTNNTAKNGVLNVLSSVMYHVPTGTALDLLNGEDFNILLLAITKAGLSSLFEAQNVTILAPSDTAFQELPPGVISDLLKDLPLLTKVLKNHVVQGIWYSAYFLAARGGTLTTMDAREENVTVAGNNSTINIGSANVTRADVSVTNGVVHVINRVLLPPGINGTLHRSYN